LSIEHHPHQGAHPRPGIPSRNSLPGGFPEHAGDDREEKTSGCKKNIL
jgi:hypothetical protein